MSQIMDIEDFEQLIAAYGSKPENWPADKRAAMTQMADSEAAAAALLARASQLDAALDARLPLADKAIEARILTDMEAMLGGNVIQAFPSTNAGALNTIWAAGMALAACFVGGIVAAPTLVDLFIGGADLMASLDIISDAFLPTEPL